MTKLLKLPSGQFFNVETIVKTDDKLWISPDGSVATYSVYIGHDPDNESGVMFANADARALYQWLEANAVAIGEDGREVVTEKEPRVKDFLTALVRGDIDAQFTARAIVNFDMTTDTLMSMAKDGAIYSGLQGWEITQRGRDYLELLTMEVK
jgi:hypothetical protein